MPATSFQAKFRLGAVVEGCGECLELMERRDSPQFGPRASLQAVRWNGIGGLNTPTEP